MAATMQAPFQSGRVGSVQHRQLSSSSMLLRMPASTSHRTAGCQQRQQCIRASSDRNGAGFTSGFVVGGVLFGALGFLFAPQISRVILGDDNRLRLPRFLEDEQKSPEDTKQDLADKIAQLNSAIDEVSSRLKPEDRVANESIVDATS
eukprot:jgi/Astpho2/288/Aster-02177